REVVVDDDVHSQRWDGDRDLAITHLDGIADDAHVGIEDRRTGGDVVFPGVPGTAQDPPFLTVPILVHGRWQGGADDAAQADSRGLVGARILERVERAVQVEDSDLTTLEADDLAATGRDLVHPADDMAGHQRGSRRSP